MFCSTVHSKDKSLLVEVWDWDAVGRGIPPIIMNDSAYSSLFFFSDDFLGQVQISLDELQEGIFEVKQYKLEGKKEATVERGFVSIHFPAVASFHFFNCPHVYIRGRVVMQQAQGKLGGAQLSNVKQRIVETLQNNREDLSLDGCGLSSCPTLLIEKYVCSRIHSFSP